MRTDLTQTETTHTLGHEWFDARGAHVTCACGMMFTGNSYNDTPYGKVCNAREASRAFIRHIESIK